MILTAGKYYLTTEIYESKNEMYEKLSRCKNGFVELAEPDYHSEYILLKCRRIDENDSFGIGICYASSISHPTITTIENEDLILLSYNYHIVLFDMKNRHIRFEYTVDSPIVFVIYYNKFIFISCEFEAMKMSMDGIIVSECKYDGLLESFVFAGDAFIFNTSNNQFKMNL